MLVIRVSQTGCVDIPSFSRRESLVPCVPSRLVDCTHVSDMGFTAESIVGLYLIWQTRIPKISSVHGIPSFLEVMVCQMIWQEPVSILSSFDSTPNFWGVFMHQARWTECVHIIMPSCDRITISLEVVIRQMVWQYQVTIMSSFDSVPSFLGPVVHQALKWKT